jgi:cell division FtsZ-interacting protein ZapD
MNASGQGHANFLNNLNALADNALVTGSLKSELKELGLSEIDLKSVKHSPSVDSQKIKLDRVINSLLPELEELESAV